MALQTVPPELHNHGGQAENYSINVPTDLHPVCEQMHLRPNLLQLRDIAKDTTCISISDQWFLWSGSRPMYNSLCEKDMVTWLSTLVGKVMLHKMHDSELEVCPLSKDH